MSGLRAWFDARSLREKRLLVVMVALAALTLIWLAIIRPVTDGLASAHGRFDEAVDRLSRTEWEIAAVRNAAKATRISGTVADIVRQQADQAGFTLAAVTPEGPDRLELTIPSARPGALTAWLVNLETMGVLVEDAKLVNNGDHTVSATLTLKGRGT